MVYVPAGEFEMGSNEGLLNEQPVHTVATNGFWIDRTEVTNERYQGCVRAGQCEPPARSTSHTRDWYFGTSVYNHHPVIYISWHMAADYCSWAGARLPTEAEWEYAARGPEGHEYPWGDDGPRATLANYGRHVGDTTEVGSYRFGVSWSGAFDMAGNVEEWVADWYGGYSSGPSRGSHRVVRGGSWANEPNTRSAYRSLGTPDDVANDRGFRCARDAD